MLAKKADKTGSRKPCNEFGEFLSSISFPEQIGADLVLRAQDFSAPHRTCDARDYRRYDLSKSTRQPHDVIVDSDGMAWYTSFGEQVIGKLDPKTGKTTEFSVPVLKPKAPTGELSLRRTRTEILWVGMMYQGSRREVRQKDGEISNVEPSARRQQGLHPDQSDGAEPFQSGR